jgi:hypothetical protein
MVGINLLTDISLTQQKEKCQQINLKVGHSVSDGVKLFNIVVNNLFEALASSDLYSEMYIVQLAKDSRLGPSTTLPNRMKYLKSKHSRTISTKYFLSQV